MRRTKFILALLILPFTPLIIVGAIVKIAVMVFYCGWDGIEKKYQKVLFPALLIILLPTLCQANGQLYPPGFIVDAADERINHNYSEIPNNSTIRKSRTVQYIFNDTDSINARKQRQFDTVKIADSWATYGRNK